MKSVAVLGSTGSIGTSALRVLARHTDRFKVVALTAHNNADLLNKQEAELKPGYVGIVSKHGTDCLIEAASLDNVDIVLNAIVGAAGLDATLAALKAGKRVALANKETLVMGGELVTRTC
jgi:1-deoxy-D-xylulose-5-phosphate reductoisomerase